MALMLRAALDWLTAPTGGIRPCDQTHSAAKWVRDRKRPAEPLGYVCAFSDTAGRAVNNLLELAQAAPAIGRSPIVPRK